MVNYSSPYEVGVCNENGSLLARGANREGLRKEMNMLQLEGLFEQ